MADYDLTQGSSVLSFVLAEDAVVTIKVPDKDILVSHMGRKTQATGDANLSSPTDSMLLAKPGPAADLAIDDEDVIPIAPQASSGIDGTDVNRQGDERLLTLKALGEDIWVVLIRGGYRKPTY